jgi:hypothetical protein
MPWQNIGEDRKIELVVDPEFRGDLIQLSIRRPVWIIDSAQNKGKIDASWKVGKEMGLHYINREPDFYPDDRIENLRALLQELTDHYYHEYVGVVVHGIPLTEVVQRQLEEWGFTGFETTSDGFEALGRYNRDELLWSSG